MKKTEWFPATSRPKHIGVYETQSPLLNFASGWMRYWNGHIWTAGTHKTHRNWHQQCQLNEPAIVQDAPWRGLTEKAA